MTTKYLVFFKYETPRLLQAEVKETPKTLSVLEYKALVGSDYYDIWSGRRYNKNRVNAFDTYLDAVIYLQGKVEDAIERHRASIATLGSTAADLQVIINNAKRSVNRDHKSW